MRPSRTRLPAAPTPKTTLSSSIQVHIQLSGFPTQSTSSLESAPFPHPRLHPLAGARGPGAAEGGIEVLENEHSAASDGSGDSSDVSDESDDDDGDDDDGDGEGEGGPRVLRGPPMALVLLQRLMQRAAQASGPDDILGLLMGLSQEDLELELAMAASLRDAPDFQEIDMTYENLVNLEDVKCTAKPEQLEKLKTLSFQAAAPRRGRCDPRHAAVRGLPKGCRCPNPEPQTR